MAVSFEQVYAMSADEMLQHGVVRYPTKTEERIRAFCTTVVKRLDKIGLKTLARVLARKWTKDPLYLDHSREITSYLDGKLSKVSNNAADLVVKSRKEESNAA